MNRMDRRRMMNPKKLLGLAAAVMSLAFAPAVQAQSDQQCLDQCVDNCEEKYGPAATKKSTTSSKRVEKKSSVSASTDVQASPSAPMAGGSSVDVNISGV